MDAAQRLEQELELALARSGGSECPPLLAEAMR